MAGKRASISSSYRAGIAAFGRAQPNGQVASGHFLFVALAVLRRADLVATVGFDALAVAADCAAAAAQRSADTLR
jgi:hypothetical protein